MAHEFTASRIAEYEETFSLIDKDGDGTITTTELKAAMNKFGKYLSEAELQDLLSEVDTDGNGDIDFQEFLEMMARYNTDIDSDDEMRESFAVFDQDGDGFISPAELRQLLINLGDSATAEDVEEIMSEADRDGDGKLSYDEFERMLGRK